MTATLEDLRRLPLVERIKLVEELWDSVKEETQDVSFSAAQLAEFDTRSAEMDANPSIGIPWEAVRARLMKSH